MAIENLTNGGAVGPARLPLTADGATLNWVPDAGVEHYSLLNQADNFVMNPISGGGFQARVDTPATASGYISSAVADDIDQFTVGGTVVGTVSLIAVYFHSVYTEDSTVKVSVYTGGAWATYQAASLSNFDGWYYSAFVGSFVQADIDALQVGFKHIRPSTGTVVINDVKIIIDNSYQVDGPVILATDTDRPTNAALKALGWFVTASAATNPDIDPI